MKHDFEVVLSGYSGEGNEFKVERCNKCACLAIQRTNKTTFIPNTQGSIHILKTDLSPECETPATIRFFNGD